MTTSRIPGYDAWKLRSPYDERRSVPYLQTEIESFAEIGDIESDIIALVERDVDDTVSILWWRFAEEPDGIERDPEDLEECARERLAENIREIDL